MKREWKFQKKSRDQGNFRRNSLTQNFNRKTICHDLVEDYHQVTGTDYDADETNNLTNFPGHDLFTGPLLLFVVAYPDCRDLMLGDHPVKFRDFTSQ